MRDMVIDGVEYKYVHGRLLRVWTLEDEYFLISHLTIWTDAAIARHLGRTEEAVKRYRWRLKQHCFNQDVIPSGLASELTGLSPQRLTAMARQKKIKARKKPGSHHWMFYPDSLPVKARSN